MDTNTMTFSELLFHGRYHIIGGVLLLVFLGAFLWEGVKEIRSSLAQRRSVTREVGFGVLHEDLLVGQTMTDGGEPVQSEKARKEKKKKA
ncbi:MAG: hypothetical protein KJ970_07080 [Candidatus Eisenbacteria bacterium]|uniref:Uncharacterized protein n=1 Tax=Eiseniibacteriota bacterium TaxID=2212470 RepID=A0A948RVE0_UNCEI|nr:hypothetical protein [Candidatus Eisenbacteria bacterium]MBU1949479.1 hypothetical protein [Candidatus Eisenbacteria bacterium]MBU2690676.1 hypothetical protein [Candidatus Eisenbacteria bacterium]